MKISEFLSEELIIPHLHATRKSDVIREIAEHVAAHVSGSLSASEVAAALEEREQLGSTAVAEGLAIPHGKLESVPTLVGCFGRSKKGVDFGSKDGGATHFFVAILAPPDCAGQHLKALAQVSRIFRLDGVRDRLSEASTATDIFRVLTETDAGA